MSSNVPWFKMALIGAFVGVSAVVGYVAANNYGLFKNASVSEADSIEPLLSEEMAAPLATNKNKKKKKKVVKKGGVKKSASNESASVDPFTAAMELIEKDASVLNKLPAELKQQVFYILLIRGETLIKDSKTPESTDKAVEYFIKAVALVSHPGEVLMSYEQTLPADIFKRIVFELQNQNVEKTKAYFASLNPETGLVCFAELEGPKATSPTAKATKQWTAVANSEVAAGTVLMSEEPDIAMAVIENVCDFCFKSLESVDEKHHLADLSYCSKFCLDRAEASYGKHLKDLKGTAAYAYQQLIKVVNETKIYAPILMLRYIASLLEDELAKQKEDGQVLNLFAHYDYLRPAYRVPRDSDRAEAVLIRTILEPSHKDIAEFLSDEIYVAMKSTVMFNSIGMGGFKGTEDAQVAEEAEFSEESKISVNTDSIDKDLVSNAFDGVVKALEPVRFAGMTAKSSYFGLYHSFAHLSHSCDPNCELVADPQVPRRLKLVAKKSLNDGEKITISYNGGGGDGSKTCAKEVIERDFYISCECAEVQ